MKALRYYFISIFCLLLISCQKSDTEPYWERIPLSSEDDWILVTSMLRNGDKIYFGTSYRGIYTLDKSTNQWSHADSNSGSVYIKIDIWQENLVLMTVGDIYLSSNDGFSRNSIRPGDYYFRDMLITDSAIFVTTEENGLFKSNNGGASWTRLDSQLFSDAMSLTSSSDGVICVGSTYNVYFSFDGGVSWTLPNTTLPGHSYFTLVNYVGNILFVGLLSDKLNVYSTDFGTTWKSTGPDEVAHSHVHYGGNYLSINHKGVWFSEHPGGPWRLRTEGIDVSSTRAILIDNEDVWVGTTSGLYKAVRSLNY